MNAKAALQLVIDEIERQDPTGSRDTLALSPLLAAKLCESTDLDVPLDVLRQDGFHALKKVGVMGYDVRVNSQLRGYCLDVVVDRSDD